MNEKISFEDFKKKNSNKKQNFIFEKIFLTGLSNSPQKTENDKEKYKKKKNYIKYCNEKFILRDISKLNMLQKISPHDFLKIKNAFLKEKNENLDLINVIHIYF